ncbi:unnamed protein product [Didymodactylos carnosus]|uniref:Uncharacterized protein n=1 Tax=Didymodactylos carnosus TaxID=1234261 RepID=A0A8S2JBN0_9BILA|nr:unnamed protein product [Didymodactylos carnosus]CAF3802366.1 unnamed protein product [Didymodactylos carnosus]
MFVLFLGIVTVSLVSAVPTYNWKTRADAADAASTGNMSVGNTSGMGSSDVYDQLDARLQVILNKLNPKDQQELESIIQDLIIQYTIDLITMVAQELGISGVDPSSLSSSSRRRGYAGASERRNIFNNDGDLKERLSQLRQLADERRRNFNNDGDWKERLSQLADERRRNFNSDGDWKERLSQLAEERRRSFNSRVKRSQ